MILLENFYIAANGFLDIFQGLVSGFPLRHTSWQRKAISNIALVFKIVL